MEIPMTNIRKTLLQLTRISVGGSMLFDHLKCNEVVWIGTRLYVFLMAVFDVSPKQNCFGRLAGSDDTICLFRNSWEERVSTSLQVLAPRF